jgi:hypothetical protein
VGIVPEIQMDRLKLPEFPAGVFPHIDHMCDAKLLELLSVAVQPYFAPKREPLGDEEDDHTPLIASAQRPFPAKTFRRLENYCFLYGQNSNLRGIK